MIFAYRFFSYHFNQKANYVREDILSIQKIYSKKNKEERNNDVIMCHVLLLKMIDK